MTIIKILNIVTHITCLVKKKSLHKNVIFFDCDDIILYFDFWYILYGQLPVFWHWTSYRWGFPRTLPAFGHDFCFAKCWVWSIPQMQTMLDYLQALINPEKKIKLNWEIKRNTYKQKYHKYAICYILHSQEFHLRY